MRLTRLLLVMMLVSFCAGQAFAQSQANNGSSLVASQDDRSNNLSDGAGADQFILNLLPQFDFDGQSSPKEDPAKEQGESGTDLMKLLAGQNLSHVRSLQFQSDATCYSIRSYLVVRDSPHSDTTHRDGYTTCVPAARFRVYSAVDHGR